MESEIINYADLDMTIWGLVMQADIVVRSVMILLLFCSVWSWAIIIEKARHFRKLRKLADQFEETFWSGDSLEELYKRVGANPEHPMAAIFSVAMKEWNHNSSRRKRISSKTLSIDIVERIEKIMNVSLMRELENLAKRLGFLATVGSTAPFIGLFGTVWGIMNSFQSIALSKDTSLAVVAPGIAEALLATALGLLAAIPAVVAYNKLSSDLGLYSDRLANFSEEFSTLLSRHIEE